MNGFSVSHVPEVPVPWQMGFSKIFDRRDTTAPADCMFLRQVNLAAPRALLCQGDQVPLATAAQITTYPFLRELFSFVTCI